MVKSGRCRYFKYEYLKISNFFISSILWIRALIWSGDDYRVQESKASMATWTNDISARFMKKIRVDPNFSPTSSQRTTEQNWKRKQHTWRQKKRRKRFMYILVPEGILFPHFAFCSLHRKPRVFNLNSSSNQPTTWRYPNDTIPPLETLSFTNFSSIPFTDSDPKKNQDEEKKKKRENILSIYPSIKIRWFFSFLLFVRKAYAMNNNEREIDSRERERIRTRSYCEIFGYYCLLCCVLWVEFLGYFSISI